MSDPQPFVVGIRFAKIGKIYHFDASSDPEIRPGDPVIVETSRGLQLGHVAQIVQNPGEPPEGGWKPIHRRATPRDLLLRQQWQRKEEEVVSICRARVMELRLSGIKIIAAEYSFDGSKLSIMFSSETEEKVDLKSLRQDMQKVCSPSQVEMRQVGPRDVAKMLCGMGACGLETRCCCQFLMDFSSISIRMAKEQGISLTPTEITGMCGRLRCCLIYEYETYANARALLPKRNRRVVTPAGEGKVLDILPLKEAVVVLLNDETVREFPKEEIQIIEEIPGGSPQPEASAGGEKPDGEPQEKPAEQTRQQQPNRPRNNRGDRRSS